MLNCIYVLCELRKKQQQTVYEEKWINNNKYRRKTKNKRKINKNKISSNERKEEKKKEKGKKGKKENSKTKVWMKINYLIFSMRYHSYLLHKLLQDIKKVKEKI